MSGNINVALSGAVHSIYALRLGRQSARYFGGGERDRLIARAGRTRLLRMHSERECAIHPSHYGQRNEIEWGSSASDWNSESRVHIGWTNDFSWGVIDGPRNNFGMVRSGLNFAFDQEDEPRHSVVAGSWGLRLSPLCGDPTRFLDRDLPLSITLLAERGRE